MAHKPFNLYKRPTTKNNKFIYYVQFYDDYGNRLTARTTGQTSKSAAETWAIEQLKKGVITSDKNITFAQFAKDWWIWDKCPYVKGRIARGANISRDYTDSMKSYLVRQILPSFDNKKLQKITPRMIEKWVMDLKDKPSKNGMPLSHTTVNHCLTCLKIMLKEAVRLEYLTKSPADPIKQLRTRPKEKSILTLEEAQEILHEDNINDIWDRDRRHYTINLIAASTGMRLGEVQALQIQHVHEKYISVMHSWSRKYGIKGAKWSSEREVPIPSKTSDYLHELIELSPFQEPEDFIFFGKNARTPIRNEIITSKLYKAFEKIGISPENRRERNITFHSWRYFYNSLMRGKIHDSKLRQLTGHKTLIMTDHYTKFNIEDFQDVLQVQENYFS